MGTKRYMEEEVYLDVVNSSGKCYRWYTKMSHGLIQEDSAVYLHGTGHSLALVRS